MVLLLLVVVEGSSTSLVATSSRGRKIRCSLVFSSRISHPVALTSNYRGPRNIGVSNILPILILAEASLLSRYHKGQQSSLQICLLLPARATTSSDELVAHSLVALVSTLKQNFGVGERFGIVGFLSFLKSNSICIIFKTERNHSIELQKKEDQICLLMSLSGMLLHRKQIIYSIIKKVYFP